jgi:hypothetical protein
MRGDIDAGSQLLDISLDEVAELNLSFRSFTGLSQLVEIFVHAGRMAEGQAVLKGMEQFDAGCYTPKLLRLKGELSLLQRTQAAAQTRRTSSRRRSMRHNGRERYPGRRARRRASPAYCAIKAAPPTPPLASSRSTIASRRDSVLPILLRRNSYWMTSALPDAAKVCSHDARTCMVAMIGDAGRARATARSASERLPEASMGIQLGHQECIEPPNILALRRRRITQEVGGPARITGRRYLA